MVDWQNQDVINDICHWYRRMPSWVISKMTGSFYNSFSWPEGWKAGCLKYYHLVLHVNKAQADSWSMDQVIDWWYQLYNGNLLVDRYKKGETMTAAHLQAVDDTAEVWRKRLYDISWFMKCLNEFIARAANKEDNCSGEFYSLPSMALTQRAS